MFGKTWLSFAAIVSFALFQNLCHKLQWRNSLAPSARSQGWQFRQIKSSPNSLSSYILWSRHSDSHSFWSICFPSGSTYWYILIDTFGRLSCESPIFSWLKKVLFNHRLYPLTHYCRPNGYPPCRIWFRSLERHKRTFRKIWRWSTAMVGHWCQPLRRLHRSCHLAVRYTSIFRNEKNRTKTHQL